MNVILLKSAVLGDSVYLDDAYLCQHIGQVLNAQVGDTLKIGVLGGKLGHATITRLDKLSNTVQGVQLSNVVLDRPPPPKLEMTVILALPRPKVLRRLIMDMTAIGVNHIVLVNSYRTDKSYWQSPLLSRLDEFVLEGLSQGVDTIAPTITLAKRFKPFVEDVLPSLPSPIMLAHPYSDLTMEQYAQNHRPKVLIVGAEGGFIPYEVALMEQSGAVAVSLGERILRTEAAVNVLLGRWL